jgi:predicted glycosyltransferase
VKRLLVYSQDGMGLGHLRRTSSVAREIVRREPDCGVLIVADSPATPPFDQIPGVDYLKLPTIVKTGRSDWGNATLPMDVEQVIKLRSKLIMEAYRTFRPDTVLVDHMPVGALGELKPMLDRIAVSRRRPRLFLSLRDIIDDPAVVRAVWTRLGAYDYLRRYDAVLIFGCKEIFNADEAYGLSPFAERVVFCNYALRDLPSAPRSTREDDPLLLVMGGGGGDAFLLEEMFLEALPMVRIGIGQGAVILTGPNMPRRERDTLLARSESHRIRVETGVQDSIEWLLRASSVLMMGGYNSLCEALRARKRALVVPRRGPSAEQRMRSRLFAERSLIRTLDPRDLTPRALAAELARLLRDDGIPNVAGLPPMDGAQRASVLLCGWSEAGLRSAARRPASRQEVT